MTPLSAALLSACAVVPNGTATGLDIGLSNFSLSLITLSFYTMCKSTTPVFLLAFCFLWGIERCACSGAFAARTMPARRAMSSCPDAPLPYSNSPGESLLVLGSNVPEPGRCSCILQQDCN